MLIDINPIEFDCQFCILINTTSKYKQLSTKNKEIHSFCIRNSINVRFYKLAL